MKKINKEKKRNSNPGRDRSRSIDNGKNRNKNKEIEKDMISINKETTKKTYKKIITMSVIVKKIIEIEIEITTENENEKNLKNITNKEKANKSKKIGETTVENEKEKEIDKTQEITNQNTINSMTAKIIKIHNMMIIKVEELEILRRKTINSIKENQNSLKV